MHDDAALQINFAVLVSRVLLTHVDYFRFPFDGVVDWHIPHEFSEEMSEHSEIVSKNNIEVFLS